MLYVIIEKDRKNYLKFKRLRLDAKFIEKKNIKWEELKNKDVIVSDDEEVTKRAVKNKIMSVLLIKLKTYSKNSDIVSDFEFYYSGKFNKSAINGIKAVVLYNNGKLKAKIRKGVANVILNKNHDKVLLLKRRSPGWGYSFVQGGIEEGESELDALKRETYEESGVKDFKVLKKIHIKVPYYLVQFNGVEVWKIRIGRYDLFITEAEEGNKISFNDSSAKEMFISGEWFSISDAYKLLPLARHKKYLEYAINYQKNIKK